MTPPFSAEQLFQVFAAYNRAVWPTQVVLVGLAAAVLMIAYRRPRWGRAAISLILAALWAWMGIAYHWAFFVEINPAARLFAALFLLESVLLAWSGLRASALTFRPTRDVFGWIGGLLVVYALIVYPTFGAAMGHTYPAQPTFGLPCPTTIFTFGILLWARPKVPWILLVVPLLWAAVGTSAVWHFGVVEDAMLPVAGIAVAGLAWWRNHRGGARLPASS